MGSRANGMRQGSLFSFQAPVTQANHYNNSITTEFSADMSDFCYFVTCAWNMIITKLIPGLDLFSTRLKNDLVLKNQDIKMINERLLDLMVSSCWWSIEPICLNVMFHWSSAQNKAHLGYPCYYDSLPFMHWSVSQLIQIFDRSVDRSFS